jgi:hypothetical protein
MDPSYFTKHGSYFWGISGDRPGPDIGQKTLAIGLIGI